MKSILRHFKNFIHGIVSKFSFIFKSSAGFPSTLFIFIFRRVVSFPGSHSLYNDKEIFYRLLFLYTFKLNNYNLLIYKYATFLYLGEVTRAVFNIPLYCLSSLLIP
jgi:hypothetical protein